MNRYRVEHRTEYRYSTPVTTSFGQTCLLPRDFVGQVCLDATVTIDPGPADRRRRTDYFGNRVEHFSIAEPHDVLVLTSQSTVEVSADRGALPLAGDEPWERTRDLCRSLGGDVGVDARHHLLGSARAPHSAASLAYASSSFAAGRPVLDAVFDVAHRIHTDFEFDPTATRVNSTIDDLLAGGAGVCQDFAHLLVSCLRSVGLPARYVSGYLETIPPPGKPKVVGADVSHAWASVLLPDHGWVDIDPTNDKFVDDRYITVAWGRDYGDITPVKGIVYGGPGTTELHVSVDVSRLN